MCRDLGNRAQAAQKMAAIFATLHLLLSDCAPAARAAHDRWRGGGGRADQRRDDSHLGGGQYDCQNYHHDPYRRPHHYDPYRQPDQYHHPCGAYSQPDQYHHPDQWHQGSWYGAQQWQRGHVAWHGTGSRAHVEALPPPAPFEGLEVIEGFLNPADRGPRGSGETNEYRNRNGGHQLPPGGGVPATGKAKAAKPLPSQARGKEGTWRRDSGVHREHIIQHSRPGGRDFELSIVHMSDCCQDPAPFLRYKGKVLRRFELH